MMAEHKKQHYIPQSYLKEWCDTECPANHEPYVWSFPKESKDGKPKAPKNIFHETDMYTIKGSDGSRNLELERGLSDLESQYCFLRNNKLLNNTRLDSDAHFLLMVFIAAMNGRTRKHLDNTSQQWAKALELGEHMKRQYEKELPEQKDAMNKMGDLPKPKGAITFSEEEVREIVEETATKTLGAHISAVAPLFSGLDFCVLFSYNSQGFITSDAPCSWYDPEAYKRPPFYRSPALIYPSTEITFPVSPTHMVYLNQSGLKGYMEVSPGTVRRQNRITRFRAGEYFVSNKNEVDDFWFDPGKEPEDSWEKVHTP